MLGKEIVIKSIEKAFPSFSSERAEALARICYSCGGFNTQTLCVVTKGIKAECNHLMRTTYPEACVGVVDYMHMYGDLRWNSKLGYLIDVPQFRDGLIEALTDFADGGGEHVDKLIAQIKKELPDGLTFTVPPDGDDAPLEEWKHCQPLDRTMNAVFAYFHG